MFRFRCLRSFVCRFKPRKPHRKVNWHRRLSHFMCELSYSTPTITSFFIPKPLAIWCGYDFGCTIWRQTIKKCPFSFYDLLRIQNCQVQWDYLNDERRQNQYRKWCVWCVIACRKSAIKLKFIRRWHWCRSIRSVMSQQLFIFSKHFFPLFVSPMRGP